MIRPGNGTGEYGFSVLTRDEADQPMVSALVRHLGGHVLDLTVGDTTILSTSGLILDHPTANLHPAMDNEPINIASTVTLSPVSGVPGQDERDSISPFNHLRYRIAEGHPGVETNYLRLSSTDEEQGLRNVKIMQLIRNGMYLQTRLEPQFTDGQRKTSLAERFRFSVASSRVGGMRFVDSSGNPQPMTMRPVSSQFSEATANIPDIISDLREGTAFVCYPAIDGKTRLAAKPDQHVVVGAHFDNERIRRQRPANLILWHEAATKSLYLAPAAGVRVSSGADSRGRLRAEGSQITSQGFLQLNTTVQLVTF
jgi:hypothetical protein